MRNVSTFLSAILAALIIGCGGSQSFEPPPTTPTEPAVPVEPADYLGRVGFRLNQAGVDPGGLTCNSYRRWVPTIRQDAESFATDIEAFIGPYMSRRMRGNEREMLRSQVTDVAENWFLRTLLIHGNLNNMGAVILQGHEWTDDGGQSHPLVVFHTATTPDAAAPGSCLRSLLINGRVHHVINLYDGNLPLRDVLDVERNVTVEAGMSYVDASSTELGYRGWRNTAANAQASSEELQQAAETVARLIREQILQPGGQAPQGNVYFHCAGGMHRSPLIMGILRRCINNESGPEVEEAMHYHSAYISPSNPGGWEQPVADFVTNFDCALLEGQAAATDEAPVEGGSSDEDEDEGELDPGEG
jgi:hypothetical protein